ncbi:MAG: MAPEG family protein [Alphaproteobacteria bacterium]|nr:MAPEG family protein [Alphaproteobacteria bacterium]
MPTALLMPIFAYIAFCMVVIAMMAVMRFRAVSSGAVRGRKISLGERNWPEAVQRVSNVAQNQWETPLLFWAGMLLALILQLEAPMLAIWAWVFVAARIVHAAIYISVNHILSRFLSFGVSLVAIAGLWVVMAMEIFLA